MPARTRCRSRWSSPSRATARSAPMAHLPWRLPEDLKRFRALTTGHARDHGPQDLGLAAARARRTAEHRRHARPRVHGARRGGRAFARRSACARAAARRRPSASAGRSSTAPRCLAPTCCTSPRSIAISTATSGFLHSTDPVARRLARARPPAGDRRLRLSRSSPTSASARATRAEPSVRRSRRR